MNPPIVLGINHLHIYHIRLSSLPLSTSFEFRVYRQTSAVQERLLDRNLSITLIATLSAKVAD